MQKLSAPLSHKSERPMIITEARWAAPVVLFLAAVIAAGGFLFLSSRMFALGFPLDDAWIHQTYARNLARLGEWSFIPGRPSSGSTAPMWSVLLASGYLFRLPHLAWTYLLGTLALFCLAWIGNELWRSFIPGQSKRFPWVGLFLLGEWHLVWASVSGMETLLAGSLILMALWLVDRAKGRAWLVVGLVVGLSVWVRPDGITLLGPAVFTLVIAGSGLKKRATDLTWLFAGVLLLFLPYLLFNQMVQGSVWPNTFYAKQAEYAVLRELPLITRFFSQVTLPLIGSGALLLPGFVAFTWQAWRSRRWSVLAAVLWFLGYALLYALRLPVVYQYGRYFMPAMPVYFVIGLCGTHLLLRQIAIGLRRSWPRGAWIIQRVYLLSIGGALAAFYIVGAGRYARDVAIIETEMVAAARWIEANTMPGDLIAAHDIGALGYYGKRDLVDLAGLISPEVIPFIRDQKRIVEYLDDQQVRYLMTFPGWYPEVISGRQVVFSSQAQFAPASGGENIAIYRWYLLP